MTSSTQERISGKDLRRGLRLLTFDAITTQMMGTFAGGALLVAFALSLGASHFAVGLIAALGPLSQIMQIPAIYLVERTGRRKQLVVINTVLSRLCWFLVAATPWFFPASAQIAIFFSALLVYYALGTVSGLAFNSWMGDLIPDEIRGRYQARRLAIATAIGAVMSLLAGLGVDYFKQLFPETLIYSVYFCLAGVMGLIGSFILSHAPEPKMSMTPAGNLIQVLKEPLRDKNFRQLLMFMGSWNFAVNLTAPFFTVYMLKRLDLSMAVILALSVVSKVFNVLFLRLWGKLSDRYSNKSALMVAGPLFIFMLLIWPFTTMPGAYFLTLPLLILIHILGGISTAGVTLCTGNIALELAPKGKATAYLAVNALAAGIAATLAPVVGGLLASWLSGRELAMTLHWLVDKEMVWEVPTFSFQGLDFLFLLAFPFGLYSLHRLLSVREKGEVERGVVLQNFQVEVRKAVRSVSNMAGLRDLFSFPYARLRELMDQAKNRKRHAKD